MLAKRLLERECGVYKWWQLRRPQDREMVAGSTGARSLLLEHVSKKGLKISKALRSCTDSAECCAVAVCRAVRSRRGEEGGQAEGEAFH